MKKFIIGFLCIFNTVVYSNQLSLEQLIANADSIYAAEKTTYINHIKNILQNNGMPSVYSNKVIEDVLKDIDNGLLSTERINALVETHSKSINEVMRNTNFSNIPGLQGIGDIAIEKMKDNNTYESLVNEVNTKLNQRFCSGEDLSNCNQQQITDSLDKFKEQLPKTEFEIGRFDFNGKRDAKIQISGNCACNPVMQRAYQGMTDFIVRDNLSKMPSIIDKIINEIKERTKKLENENKSLDSLIANTKNFNYNLQKLKYELTKENSLNYHK